MKLVTVGRVGWWERRVGTCRWAGAGEQGLQLPPTNHGEQSPEALIFSLGCRVSAALKPWDSVAPRPKVVTQKAPKKHPEFLTSSLWLRDRR